MIFYIRLTYMLNTCYLCLGGGAFFEIQGDNLDNERPLHLNHLSKQDGCHGNVIRKWSQVLYRVGILPLCHTAKQKNIYLPFHGNNYYHCCFCHYLLWARVDCLKYTIYDATFLFYVSGFYEYLSEGLTVAHISLSQHERVVRHALRVSCRF